MTIEEFLKLPPAERARLCTIPAKGSKRRRSRDSPPPQHVVPDPNATPDDGQDRQTRREQEQLASIPWDEDCYPKPEDPDEREDDPPDDGPPFSPWAQLEARGDTIGTADVEDDGERLPRVYRPQYPVAKGPPAPPTIYCTYCQAEVPRSPRGNCQDCESIGVDRLPGWRADGKHVQPHLPLHELDPVPEKDRTRFERMAYPDPDADDTGIRLVAI